MDKNLFVDSSILNVCITPTKEVGERCVELSQSLTSDQTLFVLDGETRFAHMTLFMARFANSEVSKVIAATKEALKNQKSFLCEHSGHFLTPGGYIEVSYQKSPELMRLHELLLTSLKDFRINPGHPLEEAYFTPYTSAQQNNARETGYDLAHDLYRPHITLARYKEGGPLQMLQISLQHHYLSPSIPFPFTKPTTTEPFMKGWRCVRSSQVFLKCLLRQSFYP